MLNTWNAPASGTLDLSTGASSTNVPLNSDTYLTGNLAQPCPRVLRHRHPEQPGDGHLRSRPARGACLHHHQLDGRHA